MMIELTGVLIHAHPFRWIDINFCTQYDTVHLTTQAITFNHRIGDHRALATKNGGHVPVGHLPLKLLSL